MRRKKLFQLISVALIDTLLLAACSAPHAMSLLSSTSSPPVNVTQSGPVPIVSTSIPQGSSALSSPTSTAVLPPNGERIVALGDNGQTIILQPGQRFLLALGDGYTWEINITDTAVVSRVIGVSIVKGGQGIFEARQPGETELLASGDPLCRNEKPACMMPSLVFQIKIIVQ